MEIVDLKRFPDFLKDFYRFPMQPMRFPDCFRHVEIYYVAAKMSPPMLFQIGIDMQNHVLPKQGLLKE